MRIPRVEVHKMTEGDQHIVRSGGKHFLRDEAQLEGTAVI